MTAPDPVFLGIDPSLTGFCAQLRWGSSAFETFHIYTKPGSFPSFEARLDHIMRELRGVLASVKVTAYGAPLLAAVEGVSYGSKNGAKAVEMHAVHAVTRWLLWRSGVPWLDVPPTTLKKFVTGSGVSEKNLMILKVFKRWGFEAKDDNEADACGLAEFARAWRPDDKAGAKVRLTINEPEAVL
jgi:Holliday junction resolvasome RuvABC endonuclease subunit